MERLDPYARPPEPLQSCFKAHRKLNSDEIAKESDIIDFKTENLHIRLQPLYWTEASRIATALVDEGNGVFVSDKVQVYSVAGIEGLLFIPGLLKNDAQRALLDRLLHRDLADFRHQTNVSKHYRLPYATQERASTRVTDRSNHTPSDPIIDTTPSFFTYSPDSNIEFEPLDSNVHRPITVRQFLNKKLRWITLGGQYDWTNKTYPGGCHPKFPADIAAAIQSVFPNMKPESAICNIYSPGDTLSLHRDVSEEADADLVSISIGCDALFMVDTGQSEPDAPQSPAVIRLHSGDALCMGGRARFAWHGIPQVMAGTCPREMESWPARIAGFDDDKSAKMDVGDAYGAWKDWLKTKRINLNIRQMYV